MSSRCKCGARIIWCDLREIKDGLNMYIYTCGVCGSQIEVKYETDSTKY